VFRNIDDVFPFYFKQINTSANTSISALKGLKGRVGAKYESEIKNILMNIDEKNASVQAHLRAAYVVYSAAPCKKLEYLQHEVESIREEENALRAAELAVRQLVSLLSTINSGGVPESADTTTRITAHFVQVVTALNQRSSTTALVNQMKRVAQDAQEWQRP
jgi:hypothetical protein